MIIFRLSKDLLSVCIGVAICFFFLRGSTIRVTRVCTCNENYWPQQIIYIKNVIFTFEYFRTKNVLNNLSDICVVHI